jgi:hypothetical protein
MDAFAELQSFAEDRYLHQTHILSPDGRKELVEDLPIALANVSNPSELGGEWRIHFHVPIFLKQFGFLKSTQDEIQMLLRVLNGSEGDRPNFTGHFEVETYAWGVLPKSMQPVDANGLNQGIANEIDWLRAEMAL